MKYETVGTYFILERDISKIRSQFVNIVIHNVIHNVMTQCDPESQIPVQQSDVRPVQTYSCSVATVTAFGTFVFIFVTAWTALELH